MSRRWAIVDAATIQGALTAAASTGRAVVLPPGTIPLTATLTVPPNVTLRGRGAATILQPVAGVSPAVTLASGATLASLTLDGVHTSGATGVSVGASGVVGNLFVREVSVVGFTGAGACGLFLGQGVTVRCDDAYFGGNQINLVTDGGNTPTNSLFLNCQFRVAVTKGVQIVTAYSLLFQSCLFESNGEEGIYFANTGGTAIDVRLWACWFENNWARLPLGPARHAQYECVVAGVGSGTIRPELRSCYFTGGPTSARSIRFTAASDYLLDHVKVYPEAANIRLDAGSYGVVVNWPAQNGAYAVTVDDAAAAAIHTEAHVTAAIEGPWASWTPTVTASGSMTVTDLTVVRARWKRIGHRVDLSLFIFFTVVAPTAACVIVTLPAGLTVPLDQATYWPGFSYDPVTNDLLVVLARLCTGTPPVLNVMPLKSGATWPVGGGEVLLNASFEMPD